MKLEQFKEAQKLIPEIERLNNRIGDLEYIRDENPIDWTMEVRRNKNHIPITIDHYGLLPEIISTIIEKHIEERDKLLNGLEKL